MKNKTLMSACKWLPLVPALLMLGACSVNPATGKQSFTGLMSPQKEAQVGAEEHPKMVAQFGGVYDQGDWQAYVNEVGQKLAALSERPDLTWTFTVVNDTDVNAFALPGGYVYVTRGLLALASDEAEMAGVLSHEIGHVTARHTAQRYSATAATNIGIQVLGVLSSVAGVGGIENIAAVGAELALKSYSRDQELESDMLGVRYLTRAGYDPQAMVSFFEKLRAQQRIEGLMAGDANAAEKNNLLATHPRTADRIVQAITLANKNGASTSPAPTRRDAARYLAKVDGLVFGDDVDQGVVKGNAFIHPQLRFRFDVPDGFTIKNTPELVLATDKDGNSIKFAHASVKDVRDAGGMAAYLTKAWSTDVTMKDVHAITVNGMNAQTGSARASTNAGVLDVQRIIIEQDETRYWRFQFVSKSADTPRLSVPYRLTTYSFRPLSRAEANAVQPKYIRVLNVGQGQTFQDLSASMAVDEYKSEWFEALNGIGPNDPLVAGTRVKVVK
jgi:predicted Zn-dependent protease